MPPSRPLAFAAALALAATAACAAPDPAATGPVTGTLTYGPGYSWGLTASIELHLDGETATLTARVAALPPEVEQRTQDRDEQMLRALQHRDALDGVDTPDDPDCLDGDQGSLHLIVDGREITESFGCSEPGVTSEAITAAGFDLAGILDELQERAWQDAAAG